MAEQLDKKLRLRTTGSCMSAAKKRLSRMGARRESSAILECSWGGSSVVIVLERVTYTNTQALPVRAAPLFSWLDDSQCIVDSQALRQLLLAAGGPVNIHLIHLRGVSQAKV